MSTSSGLDRRAALKVFATGAALALASCGRPSEEVVPYVEMPERLVPGVPLRFATALPLAGYGRGVLVTSMEGRPIKIDGNPRHPASLGATDVFAEADLLTLYDPNRSRAVRTGNAISSWNLFETALLQRLEQVQPQQGGGLALLTGRITSPTLIGQIADLQKRLPQARWYRSEPIDDDATAGGAVLAFGRKLTALPRYADARCAVMLDADPLGPGPEQVRIARSVAGARQSRSAGDSLRLYAIEASWTLTGALADHRLALPHELVRNAALVLAKELGIGVPDAPLPDAALSFVHAAAADLKSRRGHALVDAGPRQPPEVHALCHAINASLQAPIDFIEPIDPAPHGHGEALRALTADIQGGKVQTLIILDANAVFDAPSGLELGKALAEVPFTAHLGLYDDETAKHCIWHLPLSHSLESWSDIRAFDGTASIIQPLIRPLYDTRTAHDVLALLNGTTGASAHDLVRATWRPHGGDDFADWWRRTLEAGVVENSAAQPIAAPSAMLPELKSETASDRFTLVLAPDPSVWDGRMANNAWLQECPKPFTKQVWGNAVLLARLDAQRLGVGDGDVVRLANKGGSVEAPIIVLDGLASGTLTATVGYGRTRADGIGNELGCNFSSLRTVDSPWVIAGLDVTGTGRRLDLLRTQHFFALEGEAEDLQPRVTLAELAAGKPLFASPDAAPPTLYPASEQVDERYKWAMTIDTSACIGCNACVIACQAENNVPVVGPNEIARGRDMHWLRIDEYTVNGQPGFSPVPCMHCEHAPCEPVCPVAASIHDSEGLNVQVYNRCVGTRFCESNCPYKVRRFNFFGYADGQEYGDLGADIVKAVFNPNVTVRGRGVMEKCTYCVQRISVARRTAEKENRTIRDGEVTTACQAACPTRAIRFGDLNNAASGIAALRREPHAYALLGELGTRPRTTYLARVSNPNPDVAA